MEISFLVGSPQWKDPQALSMKVLFIDLYPGENKIINLKICLKGLSFKLRINFPDGYPYIAPTVRFASPCYHPNVDQVTSKKL